MVKEIIVFCDICNEKIDNSKYKGSLRYISYGYRQKLDKHCYTDDLTFCYDDICKKCAMEIKNTINRLKIE